MSLILPLRRLEPEPEPPPREVPRTLHLDGSPLLDDWAIRVRGAAEAMLLVDAAGRLVALSQAAGFELGLDPVAAAGSLLQDVVAVADPRQELPPLRALATGRLNGAVVRLRIGPQVRAYEVVGVPLAASAGAVAFLAPA